MKTALIIHLDAPMQSWGVGSRYTQRLAGDAPSKSALCGMVCAAMGVSKESDEEAAAIRDFAACRLSVYALRACKPAYGGDLGSGGLLRDYHTVLGTNKAKGGPKGTTVLTYRFYHQGKRFAALLESENRAFLERVRQALINPVWGVWFGRKCCIPAAPLVQEPLMEPSEARERIKKEWEERKWEVAEIFEEVEDFYAGTDTWHDQPVAFGRANSSGGENRRYSPRRVNHTTVAKKEGERRENHVEESPD